ncbi:MAG: Ig-like domain-containing protein, partial [Candidatus Marinimicrobia bacterium]|nr:Ig-like domain-containing protein [Candidatus Neomarinimicrobiota bacterium]
MKISPYFGMLLLGLLFVLSCDEENPVEPDTTTPTVSIQSPVSGETVTEVVTISVLTQDNIDISKVEFFVDDSLDYTDLESPYEYDWNTLEVEDGEHIVKVISYDTSDNSTTSQPIILNVDNLDSESPSIIVQSPISGETLSDEVLISVSTQDNEGIGKVEFFINDSLYFTDYESPYEYTWNTLSEDNGSYDINVISYDNSNNFSESGNITINILNTIDSSEVCNNQYSNIDGSLLSCDTDCFESDGNCYHLNDLNVLENLQQSFESLSNTTLLEIGSQEWIEGRLTS